jgi:hypothetical protein
LDWIQFDVDDDEEEEEEEEEEEDDDDDDDDDEMEEQRMDFYNWLQYVGTSNINQTSVNLTDPRVKQNHFTGL